MMVVALGSQLQIECMGCSQWAVLNWEINLVLGFLGARVVVETKGVWIVVFAPEGVQVAPMA